MMLLRLSGIRHHFVGEDVSDKSIQKPNRIHGTEHVDRCEMYLLDFQEIVSNHMSNEKTLVV